MQQPDHNPPAPDTIEQLLGQLDITAVVASELPEDSVEAYLRLRALPDADLAGFLGFLCGLVPDLVTEALDVMGAAKQS